MTDHLGSIGSTTVVSSGVVVPTTCNLGKPAPSAVPNRFSGISAPQSAPIVAPELGGVSAPVFKISPDEESDLES